MTSHGDTDVDSDCDAEGAMVALQVQIDPLPSEPQDEIKIKRFCVDNETSLCSLEEQINAPCPELEWGWMKNVNDKWVNLSEEKVKREDEFKQIIIEHSSSTVSKTHPIRLRAVAIAPKKRSEQAGCKKQKANCSISSCIKKLTTSACPEGGLIGCSLSFLRGIINCKSYNSTTEPSNKNNVVEKVNLEPPKPTKLETVVPEEKEPNDATITDEIIIKPKETIYVQQHECLKMMGFEAGQDEWDFNERMLKEHGGCLRSAMDALYKIRK
ncbi:CDC histidine kinase PdhS [Acrasis kona]|uniref:CDC histidine kinase PdhS n=1 Tax=Acrasis kona TaxID=1008807 RepID=A0AAW2YXK8_9EUKA